MKIEVAGCCAIIFGSLYTLLRKYQCIATLDDPSKQFNQPMYLYHNKGFRLFSFLLAWQQSISLSLLFPKNLAIR